jgi:4,4'-diaponeurosporenoate glycosyltransferase
VTVAQVVILLGLGLGFVFLARVRTPGSRGSSTQVALIVPARNEAGSLPHLLGSIADQTLPPAEIVVVDDGSTDETAAIAGELGATVVHAPPLPDGWVGKSWACHIGSLRTTSEVLVFLDADTRLAPDGLERIVTAWERGAAEGLLSVQPFHTTAQPYEQLSLYPNLMAMLASGAFGPGRRRWSPVGFGPCMVTSRAAYRSVGGHESVAGEVIEDIALARTYGSAGLPVEALAGGTSISFRMYPGGVRQLIDGWTKNLAGGPRLVSVVPLVAAVCWILASIAAATDGAEALLGATSGPERWSALSIGALAAVQVAVLARRVGRFAWWSAPGFPVLLAGFVALFVRSALHRAVRRTVSWHDRTVRVRVR